MTISPNEEAENMALWESVLMTIDPPSEEMTRWTNNSELSLVIVEPRQHPWLAPCLYNMAHVYGGKNVGLYIFHGISNRDFVYDIVSSWSGVNIVKLDVDNLNIEQYNRLLTMNAFWQFPSKHALVFQTDTLIRRPIDKHFFNYDYVGAPWPFWVSKHIPRTHNVGNGGFSLRNVATMNMISTMFTIQNENEDVFFREKISSNSVPQTHEALEFSVEHMYHENPCGLHQAWRFHKKDRLLKLLENIPGASHKDI